MRFSIIALVATAISFTAGQSMHLAARDSKLDNGAIGTAKVNERGTFAKALANIQKQQAAEEAKVLAKDIHDQEYKILLETRQAQAAAKAAENEEPLISHFVDGLMNTMNDYIMGYQAWHLIEGIFKGIYTVAGYAGRALMWVANKAGKLIGKITDKAVSQVKSLISEYTNKVSTLEEAEQSTFTAEIDTVLTSRVGDVAKSVASEASEEASAIGNGLADVAESGEVEAIAISEEAMSEGAQIAGEAAEELGIIAADAAEEVVVAGAVAIGYGLGNVGGALVRIAGSAWEAIDFFPQGLSIVGDACIIS